MRMQLVHRRGVTFLEIVFACAILAVAMIPILQTSQLGIRRTGFNMHRVTATMLTNQLMERFRTMPYEWLDGKFGGGVDMAELMKSDPILASPFLPTTYKKLVADYKVQGRFEDVCGDQSLGLLSFSVEWHAAPKAPVSRLSLGKAVINYEKFGIKTVNTQGGFLQSGGTAVASLNTDWNSPAPTTPGPSSPPPSYPTDGNTGASRTFPQNPFDAITLFGSPGC